MACRVFKVCARNADANAASVLDGTITLREPSDKSCGHRFVCQMTKGKNEKAFKAKLEAYAKKRPDLLPFNKTAFTLELDPDGRWVHNLRYEGFSSVSNHFSFHLVDQYVGVKPKTK
jgi:hypothetical protein